MSRCKEITRGEMQNIIATRKPLGSFIYIDNETWVACDNTVGEAFVESFTTKVKALKWIDSAIANPTIEQSCRVCGCTWDKACLGGCWWVEDDLCSECVDIENRRTPPFRIVPKEVITNKTQIIEGLCNQIEGICLEKYRFVKFDKAILKKELEERLEGYPEQIQTITLGVEVD